MIRGSARGRRHFSNSQKQEAQARFDTKNKQVICDIKAGVEPARETDRPQ